MRRALSLLGLVVGGLVVGLGLAEIYARYVWRPPPPLAYEGQDVSYRGHRGFRGPPISETKPPGLYRIIVGGDSVTFGVGVKEEDTYGAQIEASFNGSGGPRRVEVLNLGFPGANLAQNVTRLERGGFGYHPDLVVLGFTMNDIEGPAYRKSVVPESWLDRAAEYNRFQKSPFYFLRLVWPSWQSLRDSFGAPRPGSYAYELADNYLHNPAAWDELVTHLRKLASIGRERGVCVHLLLHTHLFHLTGRHPLRPYYDRVADAAIAAGLTVTRSLPYFLGQREKELHVGPRDPHPNALGHHILAQALLDGLRELPPACRVPAVATAGATDSSRIPASPARSAR